MANNPIPGYSIIGRGYNVFGRLIPNLNSSLDIRRPCIDIGSLESKTYTHNDATYAVPDNILVEEGDASRIQVDYGNSLQSYLSNLSSDVSISGGYGLFSAELKVAFDSKVTKEYNSWYATAKSSVNLFNLTIAPKTPLYGDLMDDLSALEQQDLQTNPYPFFQFFDTYGTHFINSLVLGGNVYLDCVCSDTSIQDEKSITTNVSAAYGALFNLDGNASWNQINKNVFANTSMSIRAEGGNVEIAGEVTPGNVFAELYNKWHKSLDQHAVPVGVTYKEIYTLIEDPGLRGTMKLAFDKYVSNHLQLIYKVKVVSNTFDVLLNGLPVSPSVDGQTGLQIIAIDRTKAELPIHWNKTYGLGHSTAGGFWNEIYTDLQERNIVGNPNYIVVLLTFGSFPLDSVPDGSFMDYLISLGADISYQHGWSGNNLGTWLAGAKSGSSNSPIAYAIVGVYGKQGAAELFDNLSMSKYWQGSALATMNIFVQPNTDGITKGQIAYEAVNLGISRS